MLWRGLVGYLIVGLVNADHSWRIVNIDQGPVKGYRAPEGHFAFLGIPYATTPTGPNKFNPPLPPPTWEEPFEAIEKFVACPQRIRNRDNAIITLNTQEDCLITNVYVPDTEEGNLPVLVSFHGGAFQFGYGNNRRAINLLKSKKIIVVNFNYRLGAHGLLCLGTNDVPGNAGMKDQITLLRWVQRNIASFGGNPNDVTIGGCSAGSASVDLVMISKLSRGLIHKVIVESGSNADSFSVQIDPIAHAKMIAKKLNFDDVDNLEALEDFFKNLPFDMLYSVDVDNNPNSATIFAPCIERDLGQEMFLDDSPINILKSGNYTKVPMLYGTSEMEGIYRVTHFEEWKVMMNENFYDFLPDNLLFETVEEADEVAETIKRFYFGNDSVSEDNILQYVQYFTDVMFSYGTSLAAKLHVENGHNQLYLYEYAYADESEDYIPFTTTRGAEHCAQAKAVMDYGDEEQLSDTYKKVKTFMRELWLNFITSGQPVPEGSSYPAWPPVGQNRTPYMYMDTELSLRSNYLQDRALFWDEIYDKHFKAPVPPLHN